MTDHWTNTLPESWLDAVLDARWEDEEEPETVEEEVDLIIDEATAQARLMQAYYTAAQEGRLYPPIARELNLSTGSFPCEMCGMLHWTKLGSVECCTTPEERMSFGSPTSKRYAAAVYDAKKFEFAVRLMMRRAESESIRHYSRKHGLPERCLEFLCRGDTKWIEFDRWEKMQAMFGGTPPGCAALNETREDDDD